MSEEQTHELVQIYREQGMALNATLEEMLNEHYSHHSERRGCGYTQATRHLAVFINKRREDNDFDDLRIFADDGIIEIKRLLVVAQTYGLPVEHWRDLDLAMNRPAAADALMALEGARQYIEMFQKHAQRQAMLRRIPDMVEREESKLIANLIADIILPRSPDKEQLTQIQGIEEKLKIGSCTLAEKYFLEIADRYVRRKGRVNIIVGGRGEPLMVEKMHLGDNHSCISVTPLILNGVRLPIGSLFGASYEDAVEELGPNQKLPGKRIDHALCAGFRFLRLTTLSVSPVNRARAFTKHLEQQINQGLFAPEKSRIENLREVADEQL